MKQVVHAVQYFAVAIIVGTLYAMLAGGLFGAAILSAGGLEGIGVGFAFGAIFGAIGGFVFSVIGGATGGIPGWGLAGFVGGLISSSQLNSARPLDGWSLAPAFILAAVGIVIGWSLAWERPKLPLVGWLRDNHRQASLLQGAHAVRIAFALLAICWSASILNERFTAPVRPGGLLDFGND